MLFCTVSPPDNPIQAPAPPHGTGDLASHPTCFHHGTWQSSHTGEDAPLSPSTYGACRIMGTSTDMACTSTMTLFISCRRTVLFPDDPDITD
jgi:hypothetical protein